MLIIYYSNDLESLKNSLAKIIINPSLRDPLQSEIMLVMNRYIISWIKMELAYKLGIVANIDFFDLDVFFWRMCTNTLTDISCINYFSKSMMIWKLLQIISSFSEQIGCEVIKDYLCDSQDKRKHFQLAMHIADLFAEYLLYRPDWLKAWQHNRNIESLGCEQLWQAKLWRELIAYTKSIGQPLTHIADLYQKFINCLKKRSRKFFLNFPQRIYIFGVSGLAPVYYNIIKELSHHIDIYLFFINPNLYFFDHFYNDDNVFNGFKCNIHNSQNLTDNRYFSQIQDKYLKKSFGSDDYSYKYCSKNFFSFLLSTANYHDLFFLSYFNNVRKINMCIYPKGHSILKMLQKDILKFENHALIFNNNNNINADFFIKEKDKRLFKPDDFSLCLHGCHSIQHEVEVLHDSLLKLISGNPSILLHEIMVMVPDIEQYLPSIKSVFGGSLDTFLPFVIVDQALKDVHPILSIFLNLLKLPDIRYTHEEILGLLETPSIATHFGFNEKKIKLLHYWIVDSGICWGFDDTTFNKLNFSMMNQYTWSFGLRRMLLGYAMDSKFGFWEDVLPYDSSRGGQYSELVGQLSYFLEKVYYWQNELTHIRTLNEWRPCIRKIIDDFFDLNSSEEESFLLLESNWYELLEYGNIANYDQLISISLIHDYLKSKLEDRWVSKKFLSGGIHFCNISSKNFIPFKIICLLGMNSDVYPRNYYENSFNLMFKKKRFGDSDIHVRDYCLFLEIILSAKQFLYISFIYCSIYDGTLRHPSILVDKLIEYISHNFSLGNNEDEKDILMAVEHMRIRLCQYHDRTQFVFENYDNNVKRYCNLYDKKLSIEYDLAFQDGYNFMCSLDEKPKDVLLLDDLLNFYRSPVRTWFKKALLVNFDYKIVDFIDHEPFYVDALTRFNLNKRLLDYFVCGKKLIDIDNFYRQNCASGLLPYGPFGELYWLRQCNNMSILANNVITWYTPDRYDMKVSLVIDNVKLMGLLHSVQVNGLLRWCPAVLSMRDGLLLWIEHLIYCLMDNIKDDSKSRMLGINSQWCFPMLSAVSAKHYLSILLQGYYCGMSTPLLLLNRSVGVWLRYCFDKNTKNIILNKDCQYNARMKFMEFWKGNQFIIGESCDPYLQRLFDRDIDSAQIEEFFKIAKIYYLPIMKFNIV